MGNANAAVTDKKRKVRVFALVVAVLIPLLVGGFSAFLTSADMGAYETMKHPPLSPPGWLFPIVWTVLYVAMGVASYFVFASNAEDEKKRSALTFYAAQLVMNMFWSTLFFTYGLYVVSFIWLIAMWVLEIITAVKFFKINRAAGYMMCALVLWTTFAAYLNLATCFI